MKVLELKGYKSMRAFNAFHMLLLGLKMLPMYVAESYDTFLERFMDMTEAEKAAMIKQAVLFVDLGKEEIDALVSFCCDKNGMPYEATNIKNLGPEELTECICAVCGEIGKFKITLLTENEKKKFLTSPSISEKPLSETPQLN